ncbi:MAG: sodium:solute symporter family protein [Verrucomicrobiota bacterium]|nr:sodium:solute symporter family protein [Verrucomicrobiota bacterium]
MSHFSWHIDGTIVGLYLLATMIAGLAVRKYVSRVEDFLVAGREMNLYLGIASLAATEFGVITCMYTAQAGFTNGFAGALPGLCQALAMFVIGFTGFCVKPLRDSGALTLPELFEKRFGKFVRWLAGVVIVLGGLLNMGVFLKIGGDFLCLVCGFEIKYLAAMMAALLLMVAIYTILGGMLSVLVTDFLQFIVMSAGLLVVTVLILHQVGWEKLVGAVEQQHGAGGFNPVINANLGWAFIIMQILGTAAATLTWQTTIARLLAAKDSATGRQIYTRTSFFFVCRWIIPGLWGIAALAVIGWQPLKQLSAAERETIPSEVQRKIAASEVGRPLAPLSEEEIAAISPALSRKINDASLHAMPVFLSTFVPIGLMGLLIAAMLAAEMSTDSSYMLSWGSVIYNDILAPFRRQPWPHHRAILWNRWIIALIGIYLFVFGLLYTVEGNIWSFLLLTGSIYLSSMSVLLIACCYWPRANNWGALGAISLGAAVPIAHLMMEKIPATAKLAASIGKDWAGIAAFVAAAIGMIAGSLLKPQSTAMRTEAP